ncbi:acyl-CoA-binding protein [Streptomyces sp. NPDC101206]
MMDHAVKAKWSAWNELKGKAQSDAESEYIELAQRLVVTHG